MNSISTKTNLEKLQADQEPEFGRMTPQHMVEHLTLTVKISSSRIKIPFFEPNRKQLEMKRMLLETGMDFPKEIKFPNDPGKLLPLRFPDLETAKTKLLQSLEEFEEFFNQNPTAKTMHPVLGELDKEEWERFHQKHFKHHFSQFGIW
ncbi:DUF1569 domain-containing protein [Algoriphagus kandeliae]|uniref:DUF1569 domain-containing protein n=1 Tax=Algoriphagus kandeliae TaxID=2562278 RepID=A0A4Y9QHM0_9BACT|nr:DUF1569 domain-containing protein [Algoriphagus kandeliae]TFV92159.1 DUF1569 domain-containing protein [Algoriphagus kandeliae]